MKNHHPNATLSVIFHVLLFLGIVGINPLPAQEGFSPVVSSWEELDSSDPLAQGEFPSGGIGNALKGDGNLLQAGNATDSGKFLYREIGEGKELQAFIAAPVENGTQGQGSAGIMVRDSLADDSAFFFLGRKRSRGNWSSSFAEKSGTGFLGDSSYRYE